MTGFDARAVKAILEGLHGVAVSEERAAAIARDITTLARGVREAAKRLAFEEEPQGFAATLAALAPKG
ncbi:hypothetical protein KO353_01050 [Elioraea tepida]|jgi:hypothetical protein|uniref:Uncharacterized protein n=1 Tax=Elioraea tepida TaxID=2843330 RepID=A0A975U4I1_9PROT|nr:hypothetical protein [Elioraea tepida]QXM24891.1 hypothetical protein KO353_01050 [Elioraea tepida]